MTLVKSRLARHCAEYRNPCKLSQFPQRRAGAGEQNAATCPDHRLFSPQQLFYRLVNLGLGGNLLHHLRRPVVERTGWYLLIADVRQHFDDDRPRRPIAQRVERSSHHRRNLIGPVNRLSTFDDTLVVARGGEIGFHSQLIQIDTAGQDQNRDVIGIGLGNAAHCVFGTCLRLDGDHAKALAAAGAAVTVGGHHGAAFVAEIDRPDSDLGGGFDQRVGWIAGKPVDPFRLQYRCDGFNSVHTRISGCCTSRWQLRLVFFPVRSLYGAGGSGNADRSTCCGLPEWIDAMIVSTSSVDRMPACGGT